MDGGARTPHSSSFEPPRSPLPLLNHPPTHPPRYVPSAVKDLIKDELKLTDAQTSYPPKPPTHPPFPYRYVPSAVKDLIKDELKLHRRSNFLPSHWDDPGVYGLFSLLWVAGRPSDIGKTTASHGCRWVGGWVGKKAV